MPMKAPPPITPTTRRMKMVRASPRSSRIIGATPRPGVTLGRCRAGLGLRKATAARPSFPSLLIPAARAPYEQRTRRMVSGDMAMYTRILFALCLAAMWPVSGHAQSETAAPQARSGPITSLQQERREAGFDPGPVNGVMTEKTTRALVAYERRMKRMPEAIASVGVDAADPLLLAQKGLQQLGFYSGPTDGALGPGTRDAIIRFEVSRHLPVDPRV